MIHVDQNSKFGKYRIIREIGRGGMGVVFKAKDTRLERMVALKVLHPAFAVDTAFSKRFRAEARAVAALNHPGIVHIHSLEESDGLTVIDMEYLPGGSLLDRLKWPALSIDETVIASAEILHALVACHASGIIHRDIKPSNILFSDDNRAVLSDFGLAKSIGPAWTGAAGHTFTTSVAIGTPVYMPPEAWDEAAPDPSWDLYATGIMMYQVIARKTPLNATTARGVVKELIDKPAPQLRDSVPSVSPALNDLVYALSDREKAARVHDAAEALERLRLTAEYQRAAAKHPTPKRHTLPALTRKAHARMAVRHAFSSPAARAVVMGLALVLGAGGLVVSSRLDYKAVPDASTPVNAAIVEHAAEARPALPGELEVAAVYRGAFHTIYDTVIAETGETYSHHVAIRLRDDDAEGVMLAKTSKKLWYLDVTRAPENGLSMAGHWAHYEGEANEFRHGTVVGNGRFRAPNVLQAKLTFTDAESGAVFTRTFTASRTQDAVTDTQYLLEAERVNELQPLLYNELLPRGLSWAREIEAVFPALGGRRIAAPFTPADVARPRIDGRLDDAFWEYPEGAQINRVGVLLGEPGAIAPELNARFTEDALYLSVRVFADLSAETTGLDIALGHSVSIPTWQSERWMYCHRGYGTPHAIHRVQGEDVAWNAPWEVGTWADQRVWHAEVRIPYASIGLTEAPSAGARWRLNVAVHDLSDAEPEQRYQWGYPVTLRIEHGVILERLEPSPA